MLKEGTVVFFLINGYIMSGRVDVYKRRLLIYGNLASNTILSLLLIIS